tara:strand:+ start:9282 stop:9902 length:621 start_codon:yes stop_codon:yes gene_type:complete
MSYSAATINALAGLTQAVDKVTGLSAYKVEQAAIRNENRVLSNNMANMAIQSITKMPMQDQINFEQSGFLGYGMGTLGGFVDLPFQQSLAQRRYGQYIDSFEASTMPFLQDLGTTRAMLNYYSPDNPMIKIIDQKIENEVGKFENTAMDYMDRSVRFAKVAGEDSKGLMPAISFQAKSDWSQTKQLANSIDNIMDALSIDPRKEVS